jgi:hypothetical protein
MFDPEAENDLQAKPFGFGHDRVAFLAIGAHGVGAEAFQLREFDAARCTARKERSAIDEDRAVFHQDNRSFAGWRDESDECDKSSRDEQRKRSTDIWQRTKQH